MKKIIGLTVAAAMLASVSAVALADTTPAVTVNNSLIQFDDQSPVILGEGTTLIPARGVFEAMGATVTWDGDTQLVEVQSKDNKTVIRLTIGDGDMKVYDLSNMLSTLLSGQDWEAPETIVKLDVAPQIMNDRTMIPLRAISEALNAKVDWYEETYDIVINTNDAPASTETIPGYFLTAEEGAVAAEGEDVTLYVNVKDIPENVYVSGVTVTVKYDSENFSYESAALISDGESVEGAIGADNATFTDDAMKASYVTINADAAAKTDGAVMKLKFKSLTGKTGEFSILNTYHTRLGYNTNLLLNQLDDTDRSIMYEGTSLKVDTNAVTVEAGEAKTETTEN